MQTSNDIDPLMNTIREKATLIRWLANNAESYPAAAWNKQQLTSMLSEIFEAAGEIIASTGTPDVERLTEEAYQNLQEERGRDYEPYSAVD